MRKRFNALFVTRRLSLKVVIKFTEELTLVRSRTNVQLAEKSFLQAALLKDSRVHSGGYKCDFGQVRFAYKSSWTHTRSFIIRVLKSLNAKFAAKNMWQKIIWFVTVELTRVKNRSSVVTVAGSLLGSGISKGTRKFISDLLKALFAVVWYKCTYKSFRIS